MLSVEPTLLYPFVIALPLFVVLYVIFRRIRHWQVRQGTVEFDYPKAAETPTAQQQDEQTEKRSSSDSFRERIVKGIYPFYRRN